MRLESGIFGPLINATGSEERQRAVKTAFVGEVKPSYKRLLGKKTEYSAHQHVRELQVGSVHQEEGRTGQQRTARKKAQMKKYLSYTWPWFRRAFRTEGR